MGLWNANPPELILRTLQPGGGRLLQVKELFNNEI